MCWAGLCHSKTAVVGELDAAECVYGGCGHAGVTDRDNSLHMAAWGKRSEADMKLPFLPVFIDGGNTELNSI